MLDAGTPSIIACDTNPPSRLAKKLKAVFHAKLFYPTHSLAQWEKIKLTNRFDVKPKNLHERDALAAAAKAFHKVENKLRQAKARALPKGGEAVRRIQEGVLEGKTMAKTINEFDD